MLRESLPRIGISGNNPRKHTNGGFFIDHIHRTAPSILLCILDGFGPILPMPYSVARSNQSNSTPTHNQRRVRTAIPRPPAQSESAAIPEIGIQKKCVWIPRRSTLPTRGVVASVSDVFCSRHAVSSMVTAPEIPALRSHRPLPQVQVCRTEIKNYQRKCRVGNEQKLVQPRVFPGCCSVQCPL